MPGNIEGNKANTLKQTYITRTALNFCNFRQTDISRNPRRFQPCYICPGGG